MARLLTLGWETGLVGITLGAQQEAGGAGGAGQTLSLGSNVPSISTSVINSGGSARSLVIQNQNGGNQTLLWALGASQSELFFRAAIQTSSIVAGVPFLGLSLGSSFMQLYLAWDASGNIVVTTYNGTASTTLGTSSGVAVTANTWYWLTGHIVASATVGSVTLSLNGTQILNLTSVNTAPQSTNNYDSLTLGNGISIQSVGGWSNTGNNTYWDDLAVNNASGTINNGMPANAAIIYLAPNGDSTPLAWTPNTGTTHSTQVAAVPATQTTNYVASSTAAQKDTYSLADLTGAVASIAAVVPVVTAAVPAGTGGVEMGIISGATTHTGSSHTLTASAVQYADAAIETDPNTSAAWTAAAVNALKLQLTST